MPSKMFKDRILNDLLPEFCNARCYNPGGFKHNFHQVSDIDADNFLRGLDAGLVKPVGRAALYRAPKSCAGEQFFWEGYKKLNQRPITLWIEPIITVATLCRLHFELGWPISLLGTQSADWAFDVTVYIDSNSANEYIACEIKKTAKEMDNLVAMMREFAALPPDDTVNGKAKQNAYKKVQGLRDRRPPLFWAVGPGGNSVAFKLAHSDNGLIAFKEASIRDLRHPPSPIVEPKNQN